MWLADGHDGNASDDENKWKGRGCKLRSTSPPLEGGEALCEFYIDCPVKKDGDNFLCSAGDFNKESLKDKFANKLSEEEGPQELDEKIPNKNLLSLLGQELLPADTFTKTFLQSILSSVGSHDPVVANAWMETLLDVIDLLPKEIIKEEILTLAVSKGQLSQPTASRLLCCRMLGKLCTKFEPYVIKKDVLPVVLSLCQDVDYIVRGCMCRQLDVVAKGMGLETTKSAILPGLVELCNDRESCVRLAGIETVVQMLPLLDDESCIQAIIPLVQKFCENAMNTEDSTLPVIAKQFGRLCHGLAINLVAEQKKWFLKFFRSLAKVGLPHHRKLNKSENSLFSPMPDIVPELDSRDRHRECRSACAYNFPAMVLFVGCSLFEEELHETFSELCSDPFHNVRKTMVSGFYEVVKFLKNRSSLLLPQLIYILNDDNIEVLKSIIPTLPDILKIISQQQNQITDNKRVDHCPDLVRALISCEETTSLSSNWRLHAEYLMQMSSLPHSLPADVIYVTFVPLLFVKLHTARPLPCRVAAVYSLLVLLRNTNKFEQRNGIINELIRDLCNGRSCHKRMLFIKLCELVMDLFSKAFFKRHFFKPVLCLSEDRVPNIRLRLCAILPKLKSLMKLPKDSLLLQELESCVRRLMTGEKDRDVIAAVNKAIEELDKIEVPTEPTSRRTSCIEVETDLEDLRKEEEERMLLEMELRMQQLSDDPNVNHCLETRSLNRQGKIPVRKSGTLPKPSKPREFKSNTLTKGSSLSSPSKRASKHFDKSVPNPIYSNSSPNLKRDLSSVNKASSNINRRSMSSIKSLTINRPPSKQSLNSCIPKKPLDRCPSPMPLPRRHIETANNTSPNQALYKESQTVARPSELKTFLPKIIDKEKCDTTKIPISETKVADAGIHASPVRGVSKFAGPVPSPEVSRKSASITGSRIPTPNSFLK